MNSIANRLKPATPTASRAGLIAVGELLVMLTILAGLLYLCTQFLVSVTDQPTAPKDSAKANSDRRVYRMSLDGGGDRLWVYRPRDGVVQLNLVTNQVEQSVPLPGVDLTAVAHSRDGQTSLLCAIDGTIALYRQDEEVLVSKVLLRKDSIVDAAVSDDGTVSACATTTGRIHGWKRTGGEFKEFSYNLFEPGTLMRIGLNRSGETLCTARSEGTLAFFDSESGIPTIQPIQIGTTCNNFAWSHDEHMIAVVNPAGRLQAYEVATGKLICESSFTIGQTSHPTCIAISPDRSRVAFAINTTSKIQLWDVVNGESAGELQGHLGIIRALQFSPLSDRLYSGSYDGTIREWSLAAAAELRIVD